MACPCSDEAGEVAGGTAVALSAGKTPALRNRGWRGTLRRWMFDVRRFLHLIPSSTGMRTRCHRLLLLEAGVLDDG